MKHYSIAEIAEMLGVHRNTILQWEKKKEIPEAKRDAKNNFRIYTSSDVVEIAKAKNIDYLYHPTESRK